MKTLIKSFALALSFGLATSAALFAESNPITRPAAVATFKTGIYSTISGKLNVGLNKEKGGAVDVRLKDISGRLLYNYHLGKNEAGCRIQLDLSNLEDGTYQLEITNGVDTTIQTVNLSTHHPSAPSRTISVK